MTFQLRYLGEGSPDPETLTCEHLRDAVEVALHRLKAVDVPAVALMSDGFVVRTLSRSDDPSGTVDPQILANAGIYWFGSPSG